MMLDNSGIPTQALVHLPAQSVPFIGRERELSDVAQLVADPRTRLVTLHGFGGTGKTRLSIEVGARLAASFPDGVWFVPLAPVAASDQVISATASVLGVTRANPNDQKAALLQFAGQKTALVILDNLEHLLPAAAELIEELAEAAVNTRLLVTSRQPVNSAWEMVYPLRGLEYDAEAGGEPAAVALFAQQLRRGGCLMTDQEKPCAVQICAIVNGLPLAIVLAASWGRALNCQEILSELTRGMAVLSTRQGGYPEKHRSMQAVFEYSLELLPPEKLDVLLKLSVFRGGFDRQAAAQVAGADLATIAELVDHSLIQAGASGRYQIHELFRQYLLEQLVSRGDLSADRDAHLAYFTGLAKMAEIGLVGREQVEWVERLRHDKDNMVEAVEWCLAQGGSPAVEAGLQILVSTERFWTLAVFARLGATCAQRLVERAAQDPILSTRRLYFRTLYLVARLAFLRGDLEQAREVLQKVLAAGLEMQDDRLIADASYSLGTELSHRAKYQDAQPYLQKALEYYRSCSYQPGMINAMTAMGRHEMYFSNVQAAQSLLKSALAQAREIGDIRSIEAVLRALCEAALADTHFDAEQFTLYADECLAHAHSLNDRMMLIFILNLKGEFMRLHGQYQQAYQSYQGSIAVIHELMYKEDQVETLNRAFVTFRMGELASAEKEFGEILASSRQVDYMVSETSLALVGLAGVSVKKGNAALAAVLLGAVEPYRQGFYHWPTDRQDYDYIAQIARAQLTEAEFRRKFAEGQKMSLDEAIGQFERASAGARQAAASPVSELTQREIEVLRLVSAGLTDQQVAEKLVISPRTVNAHLTSIYSKLGVKTRSAAASFAREKGLA